MTDMRYGGRGSSAAERGTPIDLTRDAGPFGAARFVVIDDDEANVHLLTRVLRIAGATDVHGITEPANAASACLALRPDVVFLDLHLGHLDGHDVLAQLRSAEQQPEVIVLSGETSEDVRARTLAAGARDFITKPFDIADVLQRVRAVLGSISVEAGHPR